MRLLCVEVYGAYGQSRFELYRVYNARRTRNDPTFASDVAIYDEEGNTWTVWYYAHDDGPCYRPYYRSWFGKFVEVTP